MFYYKRFILLLGCVCLAFIALVMRITYLQIVCSDKLIHQGNLRSLREQNIPAIRGNITDRMGRLLAISIPVNSVWIDPQEIEKYGGISADIYRWTELSKILSISLDKLLFLIHSHVTERFLYLARHLDSVISYNIAQLELPGVHLQQEFKRYYPTGCITAQLIGLTNIDNQGIEGVEKTFDIYLTGQSEMRLIHKDRSGRIVENISSKCGQMPQDIMLSIDERLQRVAYRELNNAVIFNKAKSGSLVLIDIDTGEVLAMTNSPSYDPNDLSTVIDKAVMRNCAITDIFEPGSTVKPIVVMAALQHKIVRQDTVVNTLPYMLNGYQIKDVVYYDKLTVQEILQKSSNVGISRLALAMPTSVLVNLYSNFGMGQTTNIGLIGESKGIYPYHNRCWSDLERATFSYGYGLMVTPLQLAKVYATIGGMGVSRPLSIVKVNSRIVGDQIFPKSLVRTVVDMMESVVLPIEDGQSKIIYPHKYRIAMKTGTVKKVGIYGKYVNKYIAYAAGVAPANNPRFALVVVIDDPKNGYYYGSLVSAPVLRVVMSNVLRIMNVEADVYNNLK